MAPLLFALGMHPLVERLAAIEGLDLVKFYLDDGVLAGRAPAVAAALDLVLREGPAFGLHVRFGPGKTELLVPSGVLSPEAAARFPAALLRRGPAGGVCA